MSHSSFLRLTWFQIPRSANALSEKPVPSVEPSLTTRTSEGPSTFSRRKAATFSSVVGSRCSSLPAGTTNGKGPEGIRGDGQRLSLALGVFHRRDDGFKKARQGKDAKLPKDLK